VAAAVADNMWRENSNNVSMMTAKIFVNIQQKAGETGVIVRLLQ
jgi:hypothetical protein